MRSSTSDQPTAMRPGAAFSKPSSVMPRTINTVDAVARHMPSTNEPLIGQSSKKCPTHAPSTTTRPLAASALDVGLALDVELLHRDRRPPAGSQRAAQQREAQPVLLGVVVHLAQQHHGVASEAGFPGVRGRGRGAGDECGDEARQRDAKRRR